MANNFATNPIILDTQASDTTYDNTHDANNALGAPGSQYSTKTYCITAIEVVGTGQVQLQHCTPDASVDNGAVFFDATGATHRDYHDFHFNGVYPKVIGGSTSCKIFVR